MASDPKISPVADDDFEYLDENSGANDSVSSRDESASTQPNVNERLQAVVDMGRYDSHACLDTGQISWLRAVDR